MNHSTEKKLFNKKIKINLMIPPLTKKKIKTLHY